MPLTEKQQHALDALEKALTKALDTLPSTSPDTDQATAAHVLTDTQRALDNHLADIRARS